VGSVPSEIRRGPLAVKIHGWPADVTIASLYFALSSETSMLICSLLILVSPVGKLVRAGGAITSRAHHTSLCLL
jgi:hypothetical protein